MGQVGQYFRQSKIPIMSMKLPILTILTSFYLKSPDNIDTNLSILWQNFQKIFSF